ncbi:hypothetical protein HW555_011965 [Spodoptera exigua]|uniref:Uncharacterized protein n=1 Tax=Spodoptera exigua TaxID=7107 RepID=A0A835L430_SPOEX|nr:hypothetical protein HW555_011965 [Spodoptera exigua]
MNKTIKSGVRELLFRIISKFEEKQQEKDVEFKRKQDCLRVVLNFLGNLKDVAGFDEIVKTIENLSNLEQKDRIRTQNQYLDDIASITVPTSQNRKDDIREWLTLNNIPFEDYHIKAELLCFVKRNTPEPVYEADELLKENGHEVLRLPPYHCD